MSDPRLLATSSSTAFLPADAADRRLPRQPDRPRPATFHERFEQRALVYDAFWHVDGRRVLLVGPPPLNLWPAMRAARFVALPSRTPLRRRFHPTLSVLLTELDDVPADTSEIVMTIGGMEFPLAVRPNLSAHLAGARLLFTMSQDNDLAWIAEWARFHARRHGTDAVVLFDNASSRYDVEAVEATLLGVPGLRHVAVPSWPWAFGATDPAVKIDPYWSHFLQNASMSVVLRRYGMLAEGLLDCDIDELAMTRSGASIYDLAVASRRGLISFSGEWVEDVAEPRPPGEALTHRHFLTQAGDPGQRLSRPRKWALDPRRPWVRRLKVHPYWHWIANRPPFSKSMPADAYYLHFKGINTGWKEDRSTAAVPGLQRNPELAAVFQS